MRWIRDKRIKLNLSQAEVARRCGMSRQRLCMIEGGKALPTRSQAVLLAGTLGLGSVPCIEDLPSDKKMASSGRLRPYTFEPVNQERWDSAVKFWGHRFRRLPPGRLAWMRNMLRVDSAIEALAWILLCLAGAIPFVGNPHQWGFRGHPLVDGLGQCLGERVLPGLYYEKEGVAFWLWPQINLRPKEVAFRVDALMLFVEGGRYRWLVVEIDGDGHVSKKDQFRQEQLKMGEVRIEGKDIKALRMLELLMQKARATEEKIG